MVESVCGCDLALAGEKRKRKVGFLIGSDTSEAVRAFATISLDLKCRKSILL